MPHRSQLFHAYLLCLALLTVSSGTARPADPVKLLIPQKTYRVGEVLTAEVTGSGEYLLESDLARQSRQIKIDGSGKIELGVVREPGLYMVRVGRDGSWVVAGILATPGGDKKLDLIATSEPVKEAKAIPAEVAKRFIEGVTEVRLKQAAQAALKEWVPANVASLGKTVVACGVCVVPSGQFACASCAGSVGGNVLGLGVEVAVQLVTVLEKDKVLTAGEAKVLRAALKTGSGLVSIAAGKEVVDRALSLLKFTTEVTVEHEGVKLFVGNAADQVDKTLWLLKVVKK